MIELFRERRHLSRRERRLRDGAEGVDRVEPDSRVLVAHRRNQSIDDDGGRNRRCAQQRPRFEGLLGGASRSAETEDPCRAGAVDHEESELRLDRGRLHTVVGVQDQCRDRFGCRDVPSRAKLLGRLQTDVRVRMTQVADHVLPVRLAGRRSDRGQTSQESKKSDSSHGKMASVMFRRYHASAYAWSRPAASTRRRC